MTLSDSERKKGKNTLSNELCLSNSKNHRIHEPKNKTKKHTFVPVGDAGGLSSVGELVGLEVRDAVGLEVGDPLRVDDALGEALGELPVCELIGLTAGEIVGLEVGDVVGF